MVGITTDELKDKLTKGHEAEFVYSSTHYSIESVHAYGKYKVRIWRSTNYKSRCIAEANANTTKDIEGLFQLKCFDDKCFYDIEPEITLENIF